MEDTGGESYCPNCGEALAPSDYFCPQCGRENEDADGPPPEAGHSRNRREPAGGPPAENGGWQTTDNEPGQQSQHRQGRRGGGPRERRHGRGRPRGERRPPEKADKRAPPGLPGFMKDESAWKPILGGIGLAAVSIVLLIIGLIVVSIAAATVGIDPTETSVAIAGAAIGQYIGFFGLALAYLRYKRDFEWQQVREYLGVRIPSLKELGMVGVGYGAIIGLIIVVGFVIQLLPVEPAENQSANQLAEGAASDPLLIAGVFALMFFVVGPCEEILYRGVIQNRLRERFSRVAGIVVASAIFASVHVISLLGPGGADPFAILTTLGILAVTSLVLGGVYELSGNLVVPWLLHSIHNSIIMAVSFLAPEAIVMALTIY
jgi:membrane protease YdiL (CAAX protease family)